MLALNQLFVAGFHTYDDMDAATFEKVLQWIIPIPCYMFYFDDLKNAVSFLDEHL